MSMLMIIIFPLCLLLQARLAMCTVSLFLRAHRETEEYFEHSGLPAQSDTDFFKFKRAAFYRAIKSKAGLAFAKAAAMRVIMHIDKSPAIVMGRPVLCVRLSSMFPASSPHNCHLPSHPLRGP